MTDVPISREVSSRHLLTYGYCTYSEGVLFLLFIAMNGHALIGVGLKFLCRGFLGVFTSATILFGLPIVAKSQEQEQPTRPEASSRGPELPDADKSEGTEAPDRPKIIEFSVHGGGKARAKIVWKVKNGKQGRERVIATNLAKPFGFEWMEVPKGATAFQVLTDLEAKTVDDTQWIDLSQPEGQIARSHLNVSLRPRKDGSFEAVNMQAIDDAVAAKQPIVSYPEPFLEDALGWAFIGNWEPDPKVWRSVFWLEDGESTRFADRRPVSVRSPESLMRREITPDFPLVFRKGPSIDSDRISTDQLLRPGATFKVSEVKYSLDRTHVGVWAKLKIVSEGEAPDEDR